MTPSKYKESIIKKYFKKTQNTRKKIILTLINFTTFYKSKQESKKIINKYKLLRGTYFLFFFKISAATSNHLSAPPAT